MGLLLEVPSFKLTQRHGPPNYLHSAGLQLSQLLWRASGFMSRGQEW